MMILMKGENESVRVRAVVKAVDCCAGAHLWEKYVATVSSTWRCAVSG